MGRKSTVRNFKRRRQARGDVGVASRENELTIMTLNVNGLTESSIHDLTNAAEDRNVKVICCTETHFRKEQNQIHHSIPGFNMFETRRSDVSGDKAGGGIIVYCRDNGPLYKLHNPTIQNPMSAFVNNERMWVLCETQSYKTAICCVYMGCQYEDNRHDNWNQLIYATISEEQYDLRQRGFRICIVGDLNGHIGAVPGIGIVGNKTNINSNGRMLLDFENQNNFSILNRASTGIWTRQCDLNATVIDYALLSREHYSSFKSMHIDDQGQYGGDSDHHPFFLVLKEHSYIKRMFSHLRVHKPTWNIKEDQEWAEYSEALHSRESSLDSSSINNLSRTLTAAIHGAMMKTIGIKIPKTKKPSKLPPLLLKEIRYRRQLGHEAKILLCQHERDKASVPGTLPSQTLLDAWTLFQAQRDKVRQLLREKNKSQRRLNIQKCMGKSPAAQRHFWSYVTNKVKKSSEITRIQNEVTGEVKSNTDDVLLETELYLKSLFLGDFEHMESQSPVKDDIHNYAQSCDETPAPKCPDAESSTSDHQYGKSSPPKLSSSDQSKSPTTDPAGFLDDRFSMDEINVSIASLNNDKAKGWDDIPNECWKNAPPSFIGYLLLLFNMIKEKGALPPKFNHGRVVLIHKKGPAELLSNYRPLTVNISMYGVYSRILNNRLITVTETHNLLGEVQAGFRKDRSAADNLFVLNTILAKAKESGQQVHKGFIDIKKAYDSVSRDILWAKLDRLGFGPIFIHCLKIIYSDDSITTSIGGRTTRSIYLSRGVRQGCSLSPILFALYISDLGHELCRSGEGFDIEDVNISALFFADDIVLLSPKAAGLKKLLDISQRHFKLLKLSFSRSKTQVISESTTDFNINVDTDEEFFTLEKVLEYKYLGLDTFRSLFKTIVEKQRKSILKAKQFKGACLNIANRGPDVSFLASCLWLNVALPTILYACESIPFSDTNILTLNRIQSQLAKCLLGVPITSPNFVAQAELGFPHVAHSLWSLQLNSYLRWRDLPYDRWPKKAMLEHLSGRWKSDYFEYITEIKNSISIPFIYTKSMIKEYLDKFFINKLNDEITNSSLPAYRPMQSITRGKFINEGETSSITVGMKVNNCRDKPTQGKDRSQSCPLCPGVLASEFHVAWICPRLSSLRRDVGITSFKNSMSLHRYREERDTYFAYINGYDSSNQYISYEQFEQRIRNLTTVRSAWFAMTA